MRPKHNLVHFKSLLGCLIYRAGQVPNICMLEKKWRVIPSLPSHLVLLFTLVKWFRLGWQNWWSEILALLLKYWPKLFKFFFRIEKFQICFRNQFLTSGSCQMENTQMRGLETDCVISGPMRGIQKTASYVTHRQTNRRTCRLDGWIGPVRTIQWKYVKISL